MPNTMTLAIATNQSITATAKGPAVRCNVSPFQGGQNHNAVLVNNTPIAGAGATILIEGNPLQGSIAPAAGDAGWYTIATLNGSSPNEQEITLPLWIRYNITVLGTGVANILLEGVQ